jgi:hypothetical protein
MPSVGLGKGEFTLINGYVCGHLWHLVAFLHITWADTRVVPVGVAIVALDAFIYGAAEARCGCALLQKRHVTHVVVVSAVVLPRLALLYWSRFVVQQKAVRVREVGRVVVLSARKIFLQSSPESSIASFVGLFEETNSDGLFFGGGYFLCIVLLLRDGVGLCPHSFSDRVEIWTFRSNSGAIVLQDLYTGLVVLQILV